MSEDAVQHSDSYDGLTQIAASKPTLIYSLGAFALMKRNDRFTRETMEQPGGHGNHQRQVYYP